MACKVRWVLGARKQQCWVVCQWLFGLVGQESGQGKSNGEMASCLISSVASYIVLVAYQKQVHPSFLRVI